LLSWLEAGFFLIQEVWIVKDGVPIFQHREDSQKLFKNPTLTAGLLSAMLQVAKSELNERVHTIKIGSLQIVLKEFGGIITITIGDDENEAKILAERAGSEFLKIYGSSLDSWDGDVKAFESFRSHLINLIRRREIYRAELENDLKSILTES